MSETVKNIHLKLQEARAELQEIEIKKSNYNSFGKYYYFDLSDILPPIMKVCNKFKLTPYFNFDEPKATLEIVNAENPKEIKVFTMPTKVSILKGCNDMQSIGGAQTFAQKYLYESAFGISETDATDKLGEEEGANDPISNVQVKVIEKLIKETNTDRIQFLTWAQAKDVKEITNKILPSAIDLLQKKKEQLEVKNKGVVIN